MEEDGSYEEVLNGLKSLSKKRDPRSVRLAAVTAALLDVIDGNATASKVYASAVTTLEGTLQQEQLEAEQALDSLVTQRALLEVLSITVAHVAPATIGATVPVTSRVLRGVVSSCIAINEKGTVEGKLMETQDELDGVNAVLRGACRAATEMLRCLPASLGQEKTIRQLLYGTLFRLFQDLRPKVRKAAHNGVCELLMMQHPSCNPVIIKATTTYVHSQLEILRRQLRDDFEQKDLIHLSTFLHGSINYMETIKIGSDLMEILMSLLKLDLEQSTSQSANFVVLSKKDSTARFLMINAILLTVLAAVEADDVLNESKRKSLDSFSARVLASLLQVQPSLIFRDGSSDLELLEAGRTRYGQLVLASCQRVFVSGETPTGCKLLPLAVQLILNLSRPSEEFPDGTVAEALMTELTKLLQMQIKPLRKSEPRLHEACTRDCLRSMEQIIKGVTYQETWSVSLKALTVLLEQMNIEDPKVDLCITGIFKLRNVDAVDENGRHAIDSAMASLVQGLGIEHIWKLIKWTSVNEAKNTGIDKRHVWILPVMKTTGATRLRLSFFQEEVLKLARHCDTLSVKQPKEATYHKSRVIDLWNLLPCFCRHTIDLPKAFPIVVPILIKAMGDTRYPKLVIIVGNGLTALASGVYERLHDSLSDKFEDCQRDADTIAKACLKLLPSLFKLVDSLHTPSPPAKKNDQMDEEEDTAQSLEGNSTDKFKQVQAVTQAIASLARLAPKPFLQNLFKKVVQRLLESSQTDDDMSAKMCSLLSMSQALVISEVLDNTSVSLLYRALKPLIRTDETRPRVQKRAYKVMAEICRRYPSFVSDGTHLEELCELLASSIVTSQISARHMRLRCLHIIVDGLDGSNKAHMDTVSKLVGEVLLCLKDSNAKTREAAYQFLLSMANTQDEKTDFFRLVTAALGAETTHMRSAAVMALSRLVFEYGRDDLGVQELLPSLLRTVLVLFDDSSREVIKSAVGFVRVTVAAMPEDQLHPLLPEVVNALLKYHKGKDRFRAKIKIILKRLVKSYGFDTLEPLVPESDTRLLTHMRKLAERDIRRKAKLLDQRRQESNDFDAMIGSDEDDSDDDRTLMTGATGFSRMTSRSGKSMTTKTARSNAKSFSSRTRAETTATRRSKLDDSIRLRNDTKGEIFDVADLTTKRVRFEEGADSDDSDLELGAMEFDSSGKLIVRDEVDDSSTHDISPVIEDDIVMVGGKRRRISKFESISVGRDRQGNKKNKNAMSALGASYKSKKAGGDVMRKGQKYEPYAFVPLDGKSYSKKNRRQAVEQMANVVQGGAKRKRR